jgi:tetratricopeptide (TPR) repeat protein
VPPPLPDDVTGGELERSIRAELSALHRVTATEVARHLVMVGRLIDSDPETAYRHAAVARDRAGRIAAVREAAGLAAYRSGRYAEALTELRTVRRLTGSNQHLPVMADCERGLGRPERALELARSPEAATLDPAGRVELLIVAAGAREDLGETDAAVLTLQVPELRSTAVVGWVARLRSAYADALSAAGRDDEARHWLELAAAADPDGETGAADRLDELDGLLFIDLDELDDGERDTGDTPEVGDSPEVGGLTVELPEDRVAERPEDLRNTVPEAAEGDRS